jgi:hypothetical protein
MPKAPAKTPALVYIKVTLNKIRPAIWRRLLLPVSLNLGELSRVILGTMGWRGGHLHVFEIGGWEYGDPQMVEDAEDERRMTLAKLIAEGVSRFVYTYDFGDDWDHVVLIEKNSPPSEAQSPACVAGERACPPEDCGGEPGYKELLAALKAPDRPESRELLEWADEDFDPEDFSLEEADRRVKTFFRRVSSAAAVKALPRASG